MEKLKMSDEQTRLQQALTEATSARLQEAVALKKAQEAVEKAKRDLVCTESRLKNLAEKEKEAERMLFSFYERNK